MTVVRVMCISDHYATYLKIVKTVNFVLCIFYQKVNFVLCIFDQKVLNSIFKKLAGLGEVGFGGDSKRPYSTPCCITPGPTVPFAQTTPRRRLPGVLGLGPATPTPPPAAGIASQSQTLLIQHPAVRILSHTGPQTTSTASSELIHEMPHH